MRALISYILILIAFNSYALEDYERTQTKKRIAPIGQVKIQEDTVQAAAKEQVEPAKKEEVAQKEEAPGKKIYDQYCHVCHQAGVAGAPKFQNEADWKPRLANKSIDEIVAIAIKGLNAMPPKGTCMTCSDADIKAAVEYMLPKS